MVAHRRFTEIGLIALLAIEFDTWCIIRMQSFVTIETLVVIICFVTNFTLKNSFGLVLLDSRCLIRMQFFVIREALRVIICFVANFTLKNSFGFDNFSVSISSADFFVGSDISQLVLVVFLKILWLIHLKMTRFGVILVLFDDKFERFAQCLFFVEFLQSDLFVFFSARFVFARSSVFHANKKFLIGFPERNSFGSPILSVWWKTTLSGHAAMWHP